MQRRQTLILAMILMTTAGCGQPGLAPSAPTDSFEASGLFGPRLPKDRALSAAERQGDFDRFLTLAVEEAQAWQRGAVLTGATGTNVDARGAKAGGTQYVYTFAAGRHGLSVAIGGNVVAFDKAKTAAPIDRTSILPASKAIARAVGPGKLAAESFVVTLAQPKGSGPVYIVSELKKDGRKVAVDARNGEVLSTSTDR